MPARSAELVPQGGVARDGVHVPHQHATALADLLAALDDLPVAELPAAIGALAAAHAHAWTRLMTPPAAAPEPPPGDQLLKIREAAARLAVPLNWLRRRPTLPFVVRLSVGTVRYSATGISRYLAANRVDGVGDGGVDRTRSLARRSC